MSKHIIYTIKGLCRNCYTCVRECPAKAIRISQGQAEVIADRCISCGNCTTVCKQGAKMYVKFIAELETLLASGGKIAAIIDPAFPAEFDKFDAKLLVAMLRKLGFTYVVDAASGTDLVANEYRKIYYNAENPPRISSQCPAIVNYIEKYHIKLTDSIAPIISPMWATARMVRQLYGCDTKIVFISPCTALKKESSEADVIITFKELREIFIKHEITPNENETSDFDMPYGRIGGISAVRRGMLQAIGMDCNLLTNNVIAANGRVDFQGSLKEFDAGALKKYHLDLLCCKGCIMGAGMSNRKKQFARTILVSEYVQYKIDSYPYEQWVSDLDKFKDLDLKREFHFNNHRLSVSKLSELKELLSSMGKKTNKDFLNCGSCGYDTCIEHAMAVNNGLAEIEMCLPYIISALHKSVEDLAITNKKLASMKEALNQSEKLASMGQLSAGIAHELNNPLGVVIMYSNILLEEINGDEAQKEDLKLIVEQAERCKRIVSGLLNFARNNRVKYTETNVRQMAENSLVSLIIPKTINLIREYNLRDALATLDVEQMTQVLNNLVKNAIEAMPNGGDLILRLEDSPREITFYIIDSGCGIPTEKLEQIFEPFYTTKGIGKGTGLGLATTYGIVKMHSGKVVVTSNDDAAKGKTGTTFKVVVPRYKTQ